MKTLMQLRHGILMPALVGLVAVVGWMFVGDKAMAAAEASTSTRSIQSARVISCAIRFPLDSVRFAEKQVTACIKTAKLENISYVHVIATASSSGSHTHNLYLSTRRAGAIEAFLNNRYPDLKVHAFGGGENPKFGKTARIFVVENQATPQEVQPGVQLASVGPPEVIEKIITKTVTKTAYRDPPRFGNSLQVIGGRARTVSEGDGYTAAGVEFRRQIVYPDYKDWTVGMRLQTFKSDYHLDVYSGAAMVGRHWRLGPVVGGVAYFEQFLDLGMLNGRDSQFEWGTTSQMRLESQHYQMSLFASRSNYLLQLGLGVGVPL